MGCGSTTRGKPKPEDFLFKEEAICDIGIGEVLLETLYLGIAPVIRMYMMNGPDSPNRIAGRALTQSRLKVWTSITTMSVWTVAAKSFLTLFMARASIGVGDAVQFVGPNKTSCAVVGSASHRMFECELSGI